MKEKILYQEHYYPQPYDSQLSIVVASHKFADHDYVVITQVDAIIKGERIALSCIEEGKRFGIVEYTRGTSYYIRQAIGLFDQCKAEYLKLLEAE